MNDPLAFLKTLPATISAASTGQLDEWERPLRIALVTLEERTRAAVAPKSAAIADAPDEVLGVAEAARRCGMSEEWLRKNKDSLPFTIHNGSRLLKFSARVIEKWKARNTGVAR